MILHNNSDSALRVIILRLDQNIFNSRAARSDFLAKTIEVTEGMRVTRLAVNGQAVSLEPSRGSRGGISTANGPGAVGLDETVAQVVLSNPVPAHQAVTLEADWNFKVPNVAAGRGIRMGREADSLYQVSQWYPRIAMYDDLRGWDTEPYFGQSEFYNNFGRWDVSLDVPAGWVVGATGTLQNPEQVLSATTRDRLGRVTQSDEQQTIVGAGEMGAGKSTLAGDRLVWHFTADTAGDFAWATSRSYVWDATRATIPGSGAIPVNILYLPGDSAFRRAGAVVRHALEFYSKLWMPYAFPQLTITDGPELGMEYPMFIMSGIGAADHETGHQWWPMMVGVNETWYGWMDEGFNQYMNILSGADFRGLRGDSGWPGPAVRPHQRERARIPHDVAGQLPGPILRVHDLHQSARDAVDAGRARGRQRGATSNERIRPHLAVQASLALGLHVLHEPALGRDLGWFWYSWLFTTDAVQGSIANVVSTGAKTTVTVRQDGQMPSPVVLQVQFAPQGPAIRPMPNSQMTDSLTAVVTWPVDVWFGGRAQLRGGPQFRGTGTSPGLRSIRSGDSPTGISATTSGPAMAGTISVFLRGPGRAGIVCRYEWPGLCPCGSTPGR